MREEQNAEDFSLDSNSMQTSTKPMSSTSSINKYAVPIGLILFGFYFLLFAIVQLITNYSQNSYVVNMSCTSTVCEGKTDSISFSDSQRVYFYIQNPSLTQNDIQYTAYQTYDQINNCAFYRTNQQMQKTTSITSASLLQSSSAFPCGKFISSYPQGTFSITNSDSGSPLSIIANNLSFFTHSFSNQNDASQWADVESERFKIWTQSNVGIGLFKYWGYVEPTVSGKLEISLQTNNPLSEQLKNDLKVIITDNKAFSGYNLSWCIFNFAAGLIQFSLGCVSFWVRNKYSETVKQGENRDDGGEETQMVIKMPKISF